MANEYREPKTVDLEDVVRIIGNYYRPFLEDEYGIVDINFTTEGEIETIHLYTNHPGKVIGVGGENIKEVENRLKDLSDRGGIRVKVHDVHSVNKIMDIFEGRAPDGADSDLRRGK